MLADQAIAPGAGVLDRDIHLPAAWLLTLLDFIATELPNWRDDKRRPDESAETALTSRLCAHMNSAVRKSHGFDFLQFRVEEPDQTVAGRKVDLVPAASAATIWVDGREHNQYATLVPIECKRLPTPAGPSRDAREYLFSAHSSTGGIQRFKAGLHGAAHTLGAIVAFIQEHDCPHWESQLAEWLQDLVKKSIDGWTIDDALRRVSYNQSSRLSSLESVHRRTGGLTEIRLRHLWIEMQPLS